MSKTGHLGNSCNNAASLPLHQLGVQFAYSAIFDSIQIFKGIGSLQLFLQSAGTENIGGVGGGNLGNIHLSAGFPFQAVDESGSRQQHLTKGVAGSSGAFQIGHVYSRGGRVGIRNNAGDIIQSGKDILGGFFALFIAGIPTSHSGSYLCIQSGKLGTAGSRGQSQHGDSLFFQFIALGQRQVHIGKQEGNPQFLHFFSIIHRHFRKNRQIRLGAVCTAGFQGAFIAKSQNHICNVGRKHGNSFGLRLNGYIFHRNGKILFGCAGLNISRLSAAGKRRRSHAQAEKGCQNALFHVDCSFLTHYF